MGAALAIAQALALALQAIEEAKGILSTINDVVSKAQAEGRDLTNDEVDAIVANAAKLRPQQQG
jgi:hypothetical protein